MIVNVATNLHCDLITVKGGRDHDAQPGVHVADCDQSYSVMAKCGP